MWKVEYKTIEEYREKHEFLLVAIISVLIFTLLTILGLYTWDVIKYYSNSHSNSLFNQQPFFTVAGIELIIFVFFIISYLFGTFKMDSKFFNALDLKYIITEKKALSLLILSTVLFISIITVPIVFFGGAQNSWHGSLLVSTSALIVLVSNSPKIRIVFFLICFGIYSITSFFYVDVQIISYNWYRSFNIGALFVITFITYRFTKKFPTIFDAFKQNQEITKE